MAMFSRIVFPAIFVLAFCTATHAAADNEAIEIVDKAVKAMGGEAKLAEIKAITWTTKGKITIQGNENPFSIHATAQGTDHLHLDFEGEFDGNTIKATAVLNGEKGWRKFADSVMEMDDAAVANEKRTLYLQSVVMNPLLLKGKGFKLETAGEEKVDDKPATGIKVIGPDGKDFLLYFDKETGLPVRQIAKVIDFQGTEFSQDTTYADFKEFDGIKEATKHLTKRDGEKFANAQLTEFKVVKDVDSDTFVEPK